MLYEDSFENAGFLAGDRGKVIQKSTMAAPARTPTAAPAPAPAPARSARAHAAVQRPVGASSLHAQRSPTRSAAQAQQQQQQQLGAPSFAAPSLHLEQPAGYEQEQLLLDGGSARSLGGASSSQSQLSEMFYLQLERERADRADRAAEREREREVRNNRFSFSISLMKPMIWPRQARDTT